MAFLYCAQKLAQYITTNDDSRVGARETVDIQEVESDRWRSYLGIDGGWGRYTPGRPWVETYCPAAIGQAEMGMGI